VLVVFLLLSLGFQTLIKSSSVFFFLPLLRLMDDFGLSFFFPYFFFPHPAFFWDFLF